MAYFLSWGKQDWVIISCCASARLAWSEQRSAVQLQWGPGLGWVSSRGPCMCLRPGWMPQATYPSPRLQILGFPRLLGFSEWERWRSLSFSLIYKLLFHSCSSGVIFPLLFFVRVSWWSREKMPWGFQFITVFFYPKRLKSSSLQQKVTSFSQCKPFSIHRYATHFFLRSHVTGKYLNAGN